MIYNLIANVSDLPYVYANRESSTSVIISHRSSECQTYKTR